MKVVTLVDVMDIIVVKLNTFNIWYIFFWVADNSQKIFMKTFNFL